MKRFLSTIGLALATAAATLLVSTPMASAAPATETATDSSTTVNASETEKAPNRRTEVVFSGARVQEPGQKNLK
ncbi:hypothetical protein BH10ACT9_BH10ACT9_32440 [soil metagenome]